MSNAITMAPCSDEFVAYPKTPRLFRDIVITEKLDGTNAQILITHSKVTPTRGGQLIPPHIAKAGDFVLCAGSRNRWITPEDDNYGFASWVYHNAVELVKLGEGRHFGEWWGKGIQRGYDQPVKRFSLFNVARWNGATPPPVCCDVVPTLYSGPFLQGRILYALDELRLKGSVAAPGFMKPEGVIVFHTAASRTFKVLLENDDQPKGE